MRVNVLSLLLVGLCSVGCYLSHERPTSADAGSSDAPITDAVVVVPAIDPIERRVPGTLPHLAWDGDEVALVVLPGPYDRRMLHRFTASLEPTASVPLDHALLGGVAWRSDRLGACDLDFMHEPVFREYSLDGTTVLSERPMFCTTVTAWADSWGALVESSTSDRSMVHVGGSALPLVPSDDVVEQQLAMVGVGEDLVFAYVPRDLDVTLVRLAPDGTVRAHQELYGYRGWFVGLAAAPDGRLALVVDTSVSRDTLELLFLGDDLVPLGEPTTLVTDHDGSAAPRIAAFDGGWVLAWIESRLGRVELMWLDPTGRPLAEPTILAEGVLYENLALTVAEDAAYVVYDVSDALEHPELALRRLPTPR